MCRKDDGLHCRSGASCAFAGESPEFHFTRKVPEYDSRMSIWKSLVNVSWGVKIVFVVRGGHSYEVVSVPSLQKFLEGMIMLSSLGSPNHRIMRVLVALWKWESRPVSWRIAIALTRFARANIGEVCGDATLSTGVDLSSSLSFYPLEANDLTGIFEREAFLRRFGAKPCCIIVLLPRPVYSHEKFGMLGNSNLPWAVMTNERLLNGRWRFSVVSASWIRREGGNCWYWEPVRLNMHRHA